MKYNEMLLKLYDVSIKTKKEKDNNYKPSNLFLKLKDMISLELICSSYLKRINSINKEELENFKYYSKLNSKLRKEIKLLYLNEYDKNNISKKYNRYYNDISSYITAIFLNELSNDFMKKEFIENYNKDIKNIYNIDLVNFFSNISKSYKNIYNNSENISDDFKETLKEYEFLSSIYSKNNINGLSNYLLYNYLINISNIDLDEIEYRNNLINYINNNDIKIENKPYVNSLTSIFLPEDDNWFSEKYKRVVTNITASSNLLCQLSNNDEYERAIGLLMIKLKDKNFFNKVITSDCNIDYNFINRIIENEICKFNIDDNDKYYIIKLIKYYDNVDKILENKENKLKEKRLDK